MECLSKKYLLDPCLKLIELKMKIQRNKAKKLLLTKFMYTKLVVKPMLSNQLITSF